MSFLQINYGVQRLKPLHSEFTIFGWNKKHVFYSQLFTRINMYNLDNTKAGKPTENPVLPEKTEQNPGNR